LLRNDLLRYGESEEDEVKLKAFAYISWNMRVREHNYMWHSYAYKRRAYLRVGVMTAINA